jgi:hypothetical protein
MVALERPSDRERCTRGRRHDSNRYLRLRASRVRDEKVGANAPTSGRDDPCSEVPPPERRELVIRVEAGRRAGPACIALGASNAQVADHLTRSVERDRAREGAHAHCDPAIDPQVLTMDALLQRFLVRRGRCGLGRGVRRCFGGRHLVSGACGTARDQKPGESRAERRPSHVAARFTTFGKAANAPLSLELAGRFPPISSVEGSQRENGRLAEMPFPHDPQRRTSTHSSAGHLNSSLLISAATMRCTSSNVSHTSSSRRVWHEAHRTTVVGDREAASERRMPSMPR